jgi:acyl-CoA reductase-like NAD-dependent aldehyde dehydrogenase
VTVIVRENPARPTEVVGEVAETGDVAAVVAAAAGAQRGWAGVPLAERCAAVEAALAPLDARVDEWAELLARETGKPRPDCRGEIGFALTFARWAARTAVTAVADELVDDTDGRLALRRVPFGVVAAVTPWNAPVILSMLKVAPALCAGNAIVVKPSPLAPFAVTSLLSELAAALPTGLLAVVHGGGSVGAALIGHEAVRKVAFTGGEVTGRAIAHAAAERLIPSVLELGGNDPAVFLADAQLTDEAMDRLVMASFATSGQVCMAAKRLYVHSSIASAFTEAYLAAAARVLVTGDPLADGVTMGPVVTREAAERVRGLLTGGTVHRLGSSRDFGDGYFVEPALVTGLGDDAPLVAQEQFGPAVPLLVFDDEDDVVARANAGELGLAASVWSADEERAFAFGSRLEAGFVFVNTHNRTGMSLRAPFGGVKASGWGREYGEEGLREYTQTCVTHAPGPFRAGGSGSGASAYPTG